MLTNTLHCRYSLAPRERHLGFESMPQWRIVCGHADHMAVPPLAH
ncbi:MAG TPA: hypothetical protein VFU31_25800 [Candidatus Binatia bacterium]|nr:hypothetical protein [Candidatus Binatia bacterium]